MTTTNSISGSIPILTGDSDLRAQYEHRSSVKKIFDLSCSLFRQIFYSLVFLYHRILSHPQKCGQEIAWKPDSQGLFVLLHGLHSDPAAWYPQQSLLQKYPHIAVFAPIVPHRGICSLEKAADPIFPTIVDYIEKHPGQPVCLLGISNGSRIATDLEVELRGPETRSSPVMVSTIAGVHLGSSRMTQLEKWGLAKWLCPDADLRNELQYNSDKAKALLDLLRAPLPEGCALRTYDFFASLDDQHVPDLDSSLPTLGKKEKFHVVAGQSHGSIVRAVAEEQISSCLQWMSQLPIKV